MKELLDKSREGGEMSFIDHLEMLRWHIVRSVAAVALASVVAFLFKGFVFDTIIFGPSQPDFITYRIFCKISETLRLGDALCFMKLNFIFINIEMAGQFLAHLKISLMLGFVAAFPYVFWQFWSFVKPALYEKELRYTRGIIFFSTLLFVIGVSFGYFVMMPFSMSFFGNYTVSDLVSNTFSLSNYTSFLTMFVMVSGILFELPMVVYFLSKIGLLTPAFMRTYRRHAVIAILIISAIITPADVGTQALVFMPVYFLYEISIFISARVEKNRKKEMN